MTISGPGNTIVSGVFSGSGSLTKFGNGMLTLAATNTFTGGTTISGGTLQLGTGASGQDGALAGGIANNATLIYDLYGSQTFAGNITGVGALVEGGSGCAHLVDFHAVLRNDQGQWRNPDPFKLRRLAIQHTRSPWPADLFSARASRATRLSWAI